MSLAPKRNRFIFLVSIWVGSVGFNAVVLFRHVKGVGTGSQEGRPRFLHPFCNMIIFLRLFFSWLLVWVCLVVVHLLLCRFSIIFKLLLHHLRKLSILLNLSYVLREPTDK